MRPLPGGHPPSPVAASPSLVQALAPRRLRLGVFRVTFGLDQVIRGWTEGVPGMKVGGMRRLIIPSEMAYGSVRAAANIPPNSDLVFDIELMDIK